jgi:hypothetical protein
MSLLLAMLLLGMFLLVICMLLGRIKIEYHICYSCR